MGTQGRPCALSVTRTGSALCGGNGRAWAESSQKVLKSPIDLDASSDYLGSFPFGPGEPRDEVPMSTNIVSSTAASALRDRWERLRSHKRIISRIKLLVEWDQGGAKETANAVTVDVSHSGCMAVVGADLPLHRRVRLIHPETGRKAEAEVVWRSHEACDAGFELLKPDATFWNLK